MSTGPDAAMGIGEIVARQREYYLTGPTRPYEARIRALSLLRDAVLENESKINRALRDDLNKCGFETYMTETGMVLSELGHHIKRLRGWMRPKRAATPMSQFQAKSFITPEPYGVTLIIAPWNYPLQLCLEPLIGAISGGNCAVLKPSAYAPATSRAIAEIIASIFPPEFVAVVEGGREQNSELLNQRFDYIFFTGSVAVGKLVMEAAAKNLTPITLELGGKSPVIVDETANLEIAARRVAFGKILNAGQTCVAPDYLLISESIKDSFLSCYRAALERFFPNGNMDNMPVIINEKHFRRVTGLMKGENAVIGGGFDDARRFIEPTVLVDITPDSPIMREEIFGPVLPVLTYRDLSEAINFIQSREKPLALYLFTESRQTRDRVLDNCSFGGGCINDTIIHLATPNMGFGGVGMSGMGSYHGKLSFDTFSHYRSIVNKSNWIDLPMRYHPYSDRNFKLLRMFLK